MGSSPCIQTVVRRRLIRALVAVVLLVHVVSSFFMGLPPTRPLRVARWRGTVAMSTTLSETEKLPEGFTIDPSLSQRPPKAKAPILVQDLTHLKRLIYEGYRVEDLDVRGDTTSSLNASVVHPVVKALHRRAEAQRRAAAAAAAAGTASSSSSSSSSDGSSSSGSGGRSVPAVDDGMRIAVAIEGGGMRGCVAGGMITALWYLGLEDAVDVVYGSSAGSLVGAYFIARQLPYFGPEVYYDVLTSAGKEFVDIQHILRSCGLGVFDLRMESLKSLYKDRMGKPVLSLDYLLDTIVKQIKPLDWDVFWRKQTEKSQVLKVVASGLLTRKAVVMSAEMKNFQNLDELTQCMKASMLLPGVTGEVVRLKGSQAEGENIEKVTPSLSLGSLPPLALDLSLSLSLSHTHTLSRAPVSDVVARVDESQ